MMTTMAALLGGVPLALGTGMGSELRRPLGITIVGGLLVSQVLTLYTTPVIYLAFDRLARRLARRAAAQPARGEPRAGGARREPLRAVHPPAGRDHAADRRRSLLAGVDRASGCCRSRRCRRSISRPSRSSAGLPGREPGDHGLRGGDAARAPVRPHRRRHRDDLDELPRLDQRSCCSSTSTATSTPPRATCRRRSTRRAASCPPNLPNNPTYRKVNPADAPILILALTSDTADRGADVRRRPRPILQQKLAQVEGVGQVFVGGGALPGGARASSNPTALSQLRHRPRGRARGARPAPTSTARRASSPTAERAWAIGANDQLLDADEYRPLIVAYRNGRRGAARRRRRRARLGRGPARRRARQRQARRRSSSSSASPAPTSSRPSTASARCCRSCRRSMPAGDRPRRSPRPHRRPSAPRCTTSSSRC